MKPNIILIMTDQQRWDSLGCYGNKIVKTPNIDCLAEESIIFDNAYSTCPVCVPARGCLLTGLNQFNLKSLSYGAALKSSYPTTIPQLLKSEGYRTIAVGKNHFTPQRAAHGYDSIFLDESSRIESKDFLSDYMKWFETQTGNREIIGKTMDFNGYQGMPYPYEEYLHPTNWVKETAIAQLNQLDTTIPFLLKVSFARPHSPYDAPKRWFSYYIEQELPKPIQSNLGKRFKNTMGGAVKWRGRSTPEENQKTRAGYYGNVSLIDEAVGGIIEALKKKGLYNQSIIIFTSDHGDMLGDHNLWRKSYAYEGSSHIPLLIKTLGKSNEKALHSNTLATLYDVLPTVMGFVNPNVAFYTDGINLMEQTRGFLYGEYMLGYSRKMDMQFVCDGRYKFIWYMRTGCLELYDLHLDSKELYNLANDKKYIQTVTRFCGIIKDEMKQRGVDVSKYRGNKLKRYRVHLPYNEYGELYTK